MKIALFYNLKFTKVYINLQKYVIWTVCKIYLFEFIQVEGGGRSSWNIWRGA
jgi:hypothetical protein